MNKFYLLRIFLLLLSIASLAIIISLTETGTVVAQSQNTGVTALVDDYISKMKNQDFTAVLAMLPADKPGQDALIHRAAITSQNLGDAALQTLETATTAKAILAGQFEFITRKFGSDAWENVDYQVVPVNCPVKVELYYTADGERPVTAAEAMAVNDRFWRDFARDKCVDPTGFCQPPVKVVLADAYDCYTISLAFNGQTETADGEYAFTIGVDQKGKSCSLSSGLCWEIKQTELPGPPAG